MQENTIIYTVENLHHETGGTTTLFLSSKNKILYRSGQCITIYFPETRHVEGKSYSISSAPHEPHLSITVKGIGMFSHKLRAMKQGDTIVGSYPYGYFYSEEENSSLVFVAGGIGIVPFRSMIQDILNRYQSRKVYLFYSNKTYNDIIFKREFDNLMLTHRDRFFVRYYLTQEKGVEEIKSGRIPARDILDTTQELPEREFFICGSIAFVRDYWRGLKESGIQEECIYTESFF